jgi:hypothetical protein
LFGGRRNRGGCCNSGCGCGGTVEATNGTEPSAPKDPGPGAGTPPSTPTAPTGRGA